MKTLLIELFTNEGKLAGTITASHIDACRSHTVISESLSNHHIKDYYLPDDLEAWYVLNEHIYLVYKGNHYLRVIELH